MTFPYLQACAGTGRELDSGNPHVCDSITQKPPERPARRRPRGSPHSWIALRGVARWGSLPAWASSVRVATSELRSSPVRPHDFVIRSCQLRVCSLSHPTLRVVRLPSRTSSSPVVTRSSVLPCCAPLWVACPCQLGVTLTVPLASRQTIRCHVGELVTPRERDGGTSVKLVGLQSHSSTIFACGAGSGVVTRRTVRPRTGRRAGGVSVVHQIEERTSPEKAPP